MLLNQNSWLNTELKTKTDELLALGREKGNEILELKCNLENKKEEVSSAISLYWACVAFVNSLSDGVLRG